MTDEPVATRSGAQALVDALLVNGLSRWFALPGAQIDPLFSALWERRQEIELLVPRHEQTAAYMALGATLSTGRPHPFAVVPGPGWLNASAALCTAYATNAPVLSIAGQIPTAAQGRGIGEMHEIPDQLAVARLLTKHAARIERPEAAGDAVDAALGAALSGRRRPVHLEIAPDVLTAVGPSVRARGARIAAAPRPDDAALSRAAAALATAKRPLIMVGSGALSATDAVRQLAERLTAPVGALRMGRGVLPADHPLAVPWPVAHEFWRDTDVVLAIGTRLDFPRRMWGTDAGLVIVRVEVDPQSMDAIAPPDVPLLGDAAEVLPRLLTALGTAPPQRARLAEVRRRRREAERAMSKAVAPQMAFLRAIRAVLPRDGFFVDEMTQVGYTAWAWFPTYEPRRYVSSGYQSTLGYGYPTALGVQAANPDSVVVSVAGDGGFMFGANELATAMRYRLPVVAIVFADGRFGNVQRIQRERYGGRVLGSDLTNPDFVRLARSHGMDAFRCRTPGALRRTLAAAIERRAPTLIEVPVGELPSPWPFIVRPRVRGA